MVTRPVASPAPTCVNSIRISSSAEKEDVLITGCVVAVVLVFSVLSIVINVDKTLTVFFFISIVIKLPDDCAVFNDADTSVSVKALGVLKTAFVPVLLIAVVKSEHATTKSYAPFPSNPVGP